MVLNSNILYSVSLIMLLAAPRGCIIDRTGPGGIFLRFSHVQEEKGLCSRIPPYTALPWLLMAFISFWSVRDILTYLSGKARLVTA